MKTLAKFWDSFETQISEHKDGKHFLSPKEAEIYARDPMMDGNVSIFTLPASSIARGLTAGLKHSDRFWGLIARAQFACDAGRTFFDKTVFEVQTGTQIGELVTWNGRHKPLYSIRWVISAEVSFYIDDEGDRVYEMEVKCVTAFPF